MNLHLDTDDTRWSAVVARDSAAAGRFLYGVKTTGIFCRPGCASRLPRRDNVEFFQSAADAEQAGYRPCKRCRPTGVERDMEVVQRVCAALDNRADERLTLADLGRAVHLSPWHLQRVFKRATGLTPHEYQASRRTGRFKSSLRQGSNVTDAVYEAGYGSSSRMYASAARQLGMSPSAYRNKGAGVRIGFTVFPTSLGQVLLAATPRGMCRVAFGEDAADLERDLHSEFPNAEIVSDDAGLAAFADQINAHLCGTVHALDLPLDIRATAFQQCVWQALRAIPYGETRSYSDLAAELGSPRATRAVASACASNPVAMLIPCHRVVRKSGDLAGYRWGIERKAALLATERDES